MFVVLAIVFGTHFLIADFPVRAGKYIVRSSLPRPISNWACSVWCSVSIRNCSHIYRIKSWHICQRCSSSLWIKGKSMSNTWKRECLSQNHITDSQSNNNLAKNSPWTFYFCFIRLVSFIAFSVMRWRPNSRIAENL